MKEREEKERERREKKKKGRKEKKRCREEIISNTNRKEEKQLFIQ